MKNDISKTSTFLSHAILLAIFILVVRCSCVQSDAPLISSTCKLTPYYDLCVSSLKSDPRSLKADVRGLALIMVDVIKAKATASSNFIKQIGKSAGPKAPLSSCAHMYHAILTWDIPEAVEALQKGDPKFAQDGTNDAANEASNCEANFHGKSPMTVLNNLVHHTCVIASAIIRLLL